MQASKKLQVRALTPTNFKENDKILHCAFREFQLAKTKVFFLEVQFLNNPLNDHFQKFIFLILQFQINNKYFMKYVM